MATYPASVLVKGNVVNGIDDVDQNDHNILKGEIIALQTYVGTNPHGSKNNLTDRLAVLMATNGAIAQSGGFPGSPVEGQMFWRPDLITAYIYSSSQAAWQSLGQSLSNNIFSFAHANNSVYGTVVGDGSYKTYYETKFKKIAGISSALIYANLIEGGVSSYVNARVTFGTASGTFQATADGWQTWTISLSGLANGTVYDTIVDVKADNTNSGIRSIIAIGI